MNSTSGTARSLRSQLATAESEDATTQTLLEAYRQSRELGNGLDLMQREHEAATRSLPEARGVVGAREFPSPEASRAHAVRGKAIELLRHDLESKQRLLLDEIDPKLATQALFGMSVGELLRRALEKRVGHPIS